MGGQAGDSRQRKSGRTGRWRPLPASVIGSTPKIVKPGTLPISSVGTRPSPLMMGLHGSDAFTTWITSERGQQPARSGFSLRRRSTRRKKLNYVIAILEV